MRSIVKQGLSATIVVGVLFVGVLYAGAPRSIDKADLASVSGGGCYCKTTGEWCPGGTPCGTHSVFSNPIWHLWNGWNHSVAPGACPGTFMCPHDDNWSCPSKC